MTNVAKAKLDLETLSRGVVPQGATFLAMTFSQVREFPTERTALAWLVEQSVLSPWLLDPKLPAPRGPLAKLSNAG